jgi:hypothetical protein
MQTSPPKNKNWNQNKFSKMITVKVILSFFNNEQERWKRAGRIERAGWTDSKGKRGRRNRGDKEQRA